MSEQRQKALSGVYKALKKQGISNIGTEDDFAKRMDVASNRKKVYDLLKGYGYSNLGSYEEYEARFVDAPVDTSDQIVEEDTTQQEYHPLNLPYNGMFQPKSAQEEVKIPYAPEPVEEPSRPTAETEQTAVEVPQEGYGLRADGTEKGHGWLGEIQLPNGDVATEYSIGVNIDGKEMEIPTLVPTLTEEEIALMRDDIIPNGKAVPEAIVDKAVAHARQMLSEGKSVWAEEKQDNTEANLLGKEYESLLADIDKMQKAGEDFTNKWKSLDEQSKALKNGSLQFSTQEDVDLFNQSVAQYNKEASAIKAAQDDIEKRRSALLATPEGKEFQALSDKMSVLEGAEKTPDNQWALIQAQAQFLRNPIARAAMGGKAPSEEQINFDLNRGEAEYINATLKNGVDRQTKKKLKARLKDLNHEVLDNNYYQTNVAGRIDEVDKELDETLRKIAELRQKAVNEKSKLESTEDALLAYPEYKKLVLTANQLRNQKRKLEHIRDKNAGDFWVNFMDVFADPNTYNFSLPSLETGLQAVAAYKDQADPGAKELLDAVAGNNAAEAEEGQFVDSKGRWGAIAANSIPFMVSIGLTGGFDQVGKGVGAAVGNVANRVAGKQIADNLLVRATGAVLGDLAAGFVSANTIGGAKTLSDFINSYYGTLVKDENGNYKYEGGTGNALRSGWKVEVGNTMEYASERAGDHLQHLLGRKLLGAEINAVRSGKKAAISPWKEALAKGMDVTLKDFGFRGSNALDANLAVKAFSKIIDISNQVGVQGYPFEAIEEYIGLLGNILLGGEEDWMDFSKLGDKETHADIWGGMLYSIGLTQTFTFGMGGVGAAAAGIQKARTFHELEDAMNEASEAASQVMDEQTWNTIKEQIDNSTNPELTKFISRTMDASGLDDAQKAAVLDYAKVTFIYRGFNAGTIAQARERLQGDDSLQSLNMNAEIASASDQIADAYMLGYTSGNNSEDDENVAELEAAVERQKARLAELTGISNMSAEDANAILEKEDASQELKDAALDYLMALGVEQGFADAERNKQTRIKAGLLGAIENHLGGKFYYEDPMTGERFVEYGAIIGKDGKPTVAYILSDVPDGKGLVPYRDQNGNFGMVSRDKIYGQQGGQVVQGMTEKVSLNDFMDGQYQLFEQNRKAQEAEEDKAADLAEKAASLGSLVGSTVYVDGNGAYAPVKIERSTNNGQNVVISGDKEALKGIATAAGIAFPGGSMLEIPATSLAPLLATEDDGSLTVTSEAQPAAGSTPAEAPKPATSLDNIVGTQVEITLPNGQRQDVEVVSVDGRNVSYTYEDEDGNTKKGKMSRDAFVRAMSGTEVVPESAPVQAPKPEPAPAPAPVQTPEPAPAPAQNGEKPIPVDRITGKKVYDHQDVTPYQAYKDLYKGSEENPKRQENADKYVTRRHEEAKKALEDAQKLIADGAEEKRKIDNWNLRDTEDLEDLERRQEEAKKKIDERIAEAQASLPELQRKEDFWGQIRQVADKQTEIRKQKEALAKEIEKNGGIHPNELTPRTIEEAVANGLAEFFNGGGLLNQESVLDLVGHNQLTALKNQGYGFVMSNKPEALTVDDFVHNFLNDGQLINDENEQDAINEVDSLLRSKTRGDLGTLILKNRQAEKAKQDAEAKDLEDDDLPMSVVNESVQQVLNSADSALHEAKTADGMAGILSKMFKELGAAVVSVQTRATVVDALTQDGGTETEINDVKDTLSKTGKGTGKRFRGFFAAGKVYIIADDIVSAEDALLTEIHEAKHLENEMTGAPRESLQTGVTRDELFTALSKLTKSGDIYKAYSDVDLADEILANAATIAEQSGVESIPEKLKEAGINNEEFINFVQNNIQNGRRGQYNSQTGPASSEPGRGRGGSEQNVRNSVAESGESDGSAGFDGRSGQAAEAGEVVSSQKALIEEINADTGGHIDGEDGQNVPVKFSVTSTAEGVGLIVSPEDKSGNVTFRTADGRVFDGKHPLSVEDVKGQENSIMNYMMTDALSLGTITPEQAEIIWQKYTDVLNRMLEKGMAINGISGYERLSSQWQWVGETVYKSVHDNSDSQYKHSIDITRVCKKNEAVIKAISALQRRLGYGITPGQVMDIYLYGTEEGYQVPCPVCYVFSRYIDNGYIATVAINGQKKFGKYLVDPSTLTEAQKKLEVAKWGKRLKEVDDQNKKFKKVIDAAKKEIKYTLQEIRRLSNIATDESIPAKRREEAIKKVHELDARYKAALNVVSQSSLDKWIKNFAIKGIKKRKDGTYDVSKATLRDDSFMPFPEEYALDIRLTAETIEKYPAIQRMRKSLGSSGGKAIQFASNNDLGDVPMLLGHSESDHAPNYYKQAVDAQSEEERTKLLEKAHVQFKKAVLYARQQSLRGGQRMWSWSDNIERLAPDVFMNLMQIQMLDGALQSYSKQLEGINLVANMGGYVNGSLMGYGNGYLDVPADNIEEVDGTEVLKSDITDTVTEYVDGEKVERTRVLANAGSPIFTDVDGKKVVLAFDDIVGIDPYGVEVNGKHLRGLFELNGALDKAGNIIVGMNDTHVRAAMADDRIFFIIPWHASGQSVHILKQMLDILGVDTKSFAPQDFTAVQEEKDPTKGSKKTDEDGEVAEEVEVEDTTTLNPNLIEFWESHKLDMGDAGSKIPSGKDGKLSPEQKHYRELREAIFAGEADKYLPEIEADAFLSQVLRKVNERVKGDAKMTADDNNYIYPYEYWDETSTFDTADVNGARYLEYCRRLGRKPKFVGKLDPTAKNQFGDFSGDKGYWKLLIDRRMYDTNGNYQDLTPVSTEGFQTDYADPAWTESEFKVTKVADDLGVERIADRTFESEKALPGGIATVNYGLSLESAANRYRKVNPSLKLSVVGSALADNDVIVDDEAIMNEYGLENITMTRRGDVVTLNKIVVADQHKGMGTKFMNELTTDADANGWTLALTPSDEFGATSVSRLKKFYKRFGFKENKGKNTDFTINESMVRRPGRPVLFSVVYHGTGADFDRFDHSHMSEGQGSQVYGWGTYLTSNQTTAENYANSTQGLNANSQIQGDVSAIFSRLHNMFGDDVAKMREYLDENQHVDDDVKADVNKILDAYESADEWMRQQIIKKYKEVSRVGRHLYSVEIPDDNGQNYIVWDAPLTDEQSDKIMQEIREQVGEDWGEEFEYELKSALGHGTYGKYVEGGLNYFLGDQKNYATGEDVGAERNSKLLHSLGIVGFKIPVDYLGGQRYGGFNYVIFDESDMKIVDHTRFSVVNDNQRIFVSNAEAAVDRIKMDKATPEQWLKMLEKEGGLKSGEDKWLGLSDWLKASTAKTLTKKEVLDFIDQNKIRIEEVSYSEKGARDIERSIEDDIQDRIGRGKTLRELQEEIDEILSSGAIADALGSEPKTEDVDNYLTDAMKEAYGDDFEMGYYIMDGEIYYNIDPYDIDPDLYNSEFATNDDKVINATRLQYTTRGLDNKREIALTVPTIEPWNEGDNVHFGDAGEGRAIAWSRFGDATIPNEELADADYAYRDAAKALNEYRDELKEKYKDSEDPYYKAANAEEKAKLDGLKATEKAAYEELQQKKSSPQRVLFIDEIQSKRHQEAREIGYTDNENVARLEQKWRDASAAYDAYVDSMKEKYGGFEGMAGKLTEEENQRAIELNDASIEAANAVDRAKGGIPVAPFEKNWHELAMKRMLRLAAEEGYDYVAWTTGDQQAERYNIGNVLNGVHRGYDRDGHPMFTVYPKNNEAVDILNIRTDNDGKILYSSNTELVGKTLGDVFGKELAVKMLSADEDSYLDSGDIRVGGEGMKGFYDDILVRFVNKYAKKWGIKTDDRLVELNDGSYIEAHTIPVSPEMRESVMRGQTMFSVVSDQELIDKLEAEEKIEGVRELVRNADGSYVPPMATGLAHPKNPKVVVPGFTGTFRKGDWLEREEHPELVDEDGNILLVKGGIGRNMTPVKAKNDPYEHIRLDAINRQFKDAWKRPDLVFVKVQVPKSEAVDLRGIKDVNEKIARSPYIAEKAFLPVGIHDWNGGPLILSRYDKIGDEYTWEEVADIWAEDPAWKKNGIPFDNVNPALLPLLQERGIKILHPHKGMGEDCVECYKAWLNGDTEAYEAWRDTGKAPKDGGMRASVVAAEEDVTAKVLDSMSPKIGTDIERITSEQMPDGHKTDKGFYDKKTGKLSIAMDNVLGERDAIATAIHETVGHHGLANILGDQFADALARVYASLDSEGRSWVNGYISDNRLEAGNEAIALGISEYLSNLAKSGNYGETWDGIKSAFENAVDDAFSLDGFIFTDNEMNYILQANYEHMKNPNWLGNPIGEARDILLKRELGINESDSHRPIDPNNPTSTVKFSVEGTGVADVDYNAKMDRLSTAIIMENQDADEPVRIGYDTIKREKSIEEIPEDQDYLTIHNLASSRAETESHNFELFQFTPLLEHVFEIQGKLLNGKKGKQERQNAYERIMDYMYAVSGLERNDYKNAQVDTARREALDAAEERAEAEREKVRHPDGYTLSKETQDKLIKKIDEDLAKEINAINERYNKMKRDWSGITDLMGRPAEEWVEAEDDARAMIEEFRNEVDDDAMLEELWNRVRACTDYNLDHAFQYGLLTKQEYETLRGTDTKPRMWEYYLPLRGFNERTAEEEFSYSTFVGDTGRKDSPVVKKMKGRTTRADNPLANILRIAEEEIVQGNENRAKQALYRFVFNVGENTLLTEVQPWYVKDPSTNKWSLAEPFDVDPATGVPETMEDFEARMQAAKESGYAKKGRKGLKIDQIMANKAHRSEHMIRLKIGGVDKLIWVNGNPAMAKAVNGMGRAQNLQWIRRASRALSNLFTTYSLDFTAKNLIRDTIYSRVALAVKEDKAYRHKFTKNWLKNFGYGLFAFPMVRLASKWENGTLQQIPADERTKQEQMFIDFMTDGGQTGYTIINSVDQIKKDLERAMRRAKADENWAMKILHFYPRFVKTLNEGFELLTRFTAYETSRDMGRSGQRAASDAKEISVNFNRRGAQSGKGGVVGIAAAYLGATHYFYNAGVQGFQNFLHLFKMKPGKMTAFTSGFALMGILTPMVNAALAGLFSGDGDDDDKKADWYWNLPEWVRRNNIVLGGGKWYIAIPLPVELRAAYGIGDIAASYMQHKVAARNWADFSLDVMNTAMEVLPFNPVEGFSPSNKNLGDALIRATVPDAAIFFVDWATNRDYTGRPLWKENQFGDFNPKSYGAYASTSKALVEACQKMAEATSSMPLHIDMPPGWWRDLGKNYFGGFYRAAEDVSKIVYRDKERPFRWDSVPFFSGFTGHLDEDRSNTFITNALYDYADMQEDIVKRIKTAAGTKHLSIEDIFDNPEELVKSHDTVALLATMRTRKKEYELAKMYREGMNTQYKWLPRKRDSKYGKKGELYKSHEVEKYGVDALRDKWKKAKEDWVAGRVEEQVVEDAWHEYYNAQADLVDKLMNYEYDNPGPSANQRIYKAVKNLKK